MSMDLIVIRRALELSFTILEALDYIEEKMDEYKYNIIINLFEDIFIAFYTIEKCLRPYINDLAEEEICYYFENVKEQIEITVDALEFKTDKIPEDKIVLLLTILREWQKELEKIIAPQVIT